MIENKYELNEYYTSYIMGIKLCMYYNDESNR